MAENFRKHGEHQEEGRKNFEKNINKQKYVTKDKLRIKTIHLKTHHRNLNCT